MSTPGNTSIFGSSIVYGQVDYGPTFGNIYRPLNQRRMFMDSGDDTIQRFDQLIIYRKTVPAAFNVFLPDCYQWMNNPWGGFDLICKDGLQNSATYPITFMPFAGQTIDGQFASATLATNGATVIFSPLPDGSGWVTL